MTSIFRSSKNIETCSVNNILLHSKYNPYKEAERNIKFQFEKHSHNKNIKLVIVLGCSLGYEIESVNTYYPHAKVLCVFFDQILYDRSSQDNKILYVDTNSNDVLRKTIKLLSTSIATVDIATIHWQPAIKVWANKCAACVEVIKEVLSLSIAHSNTTQFFMRQWIVNAVSNYLNIDTVYVPMTQSNKDVIVIGAGNTLLNHVHDIKRFRNNYIIISVSSALMCLYEHDIVPDIVVHQDSSYYSSLHLFPLSQFLQKHHIKVAIPLNTSRHSLFNTNNADMIFLNTGQEVERLLELNAAHCVHVEAYATVMGTAIELAWHLSSSKIYLSGFDLSIDIHGFHCYPHVSQNLFFHGTRLKPFETMSRLEYTHASNSHSTHRYKMPVKQTIALTTYEKWFKNWKNSNKTRTYVLAKHEPIALGFNKISSLPHAVKTQSLPKEEKIQYKTITRASYKERKSFLLQQLANWKNFVPCPSPSALHNKSNTHHKDFDVIKSITANLSTENVQAIFDQITGLLG